jgi:hypothetical protein
MAFIYLHLVFLWELDSHQRGSGPRGAAMGQILRTPWPSWPGWSRSSFRRSS